MVSAQGHLDLESKNILRVIRDISIGPQVAPESFPLVSIIAPTWCAGPSVGFGGPTCSRVPVHPGGGGGTYDCMQV